MSEIYITNIIIYKHLMYISLSVMLLDVQAVFAEYLTSETQFTGNTFSPNSPTPSVILMALVSTSLCCVTPTLCRHNTHNLQVSSSSCFEICHLKFKIIYRYTVYIIIIIIIIKNEKIRVTLCENAAGALYIVNMCQSKSCTYL